MGIKKASALNFGVWLFLVGISIFQSSWAASSQTDQDLIAAKPDSIPLLLENEVGNPYHVVLLIGIHPDGTDALDSGLDQPFPPPFPGR